MTLPTGALGREVITHVQFVETRAQHVAIGRSWLTFDGHPGFGENPPAPLALGVLQTGGHERSLATLAPCFGQRGGCGFSLRLGELCVHMKLCTHGVVYA